MQFKLGTPRRAPAFIAGLAVAAVAGGGIAYAAIPSTDGTVNACYAKTGTATELKGTLRAVDLGEACKANETAISWNQKGQKGDTGSQGLPGVNGANGQNGQNGLNGPTGPTGPAGVAGVQGIQGPQGVAGAVGPSGSVGATGEVGPAGPKGDTGAAGPAGPKGATGDAGTPDTMYASGRIDDFQRAIDFAAPYGLTDFLPGRDQTFPSGRVEAPPAYLPWDFTKSRTHVSDFTAVLDGTAPSDVTFELWDKATSYIIGGCIVPAGSRICSLPLSPDLVWSDTLSASGGQYIQLQKSGNASDVSGIFSYKLSK